MSEPQPDWPPRRTRFHEIIEEAVAEYERVCGLLQVERPVEANVLEAQRHMQAGRPVEPNVVEAREIPELESLSRATRHQCEDDGGEDSISFVQAFEERAPLVELPGQLRHDDWLAVRSEDTESMKSKKGEEDRGMVVSMAWWSLMVEYMSRKGSTLVFIVRKCWNGDDGSTRITKMMRGGLDQSFFGERVQEDAVRLVWHELEARGRRVAVARALVTKTTTVFTEVEGQPTCWSWMIHPCSTWHLLWVLMSLCFLAIDVLFASMFMFEIEQSVVWEAIDCAYWSADVAVNFRTGIYRKFHGLDMDPRSVGKTYIKTWFGFDLCLAVIQWAMWSVAAERELRSAQILWWMRFVRSARLLRLTKLGRRMSVVMGRIQSLPALLIMKMSLYMLCLVVWVHLSGCGWYWVGQTDGGWVEIMKAQRGEEYSKMPLSYLASTHWAATQLQGNSSIEPGTSTAAYTFALVHLLASIVVFVALISRLTTILHNLVKSTAQRRLLLDSARSYCKSHDISTDLFMRVSTYIRRAEDVKGKQFHNRGELELLQVLPKNLIRELLLEARGPFLNKHLFFITLGRICLRFHERLCCDVLHATFHMPGESIYSQGTIAKCTYFVAAGDTSLFTYGFVYQAMKNSITRVITTDHRDFFEKMKGLKTEVLKEGTAVCEAALWVRWVHCGDFDALSQASLLTIDVNTFEELVKSYVPVQEAMLMHACRIATALNDTATLSDLFTSITALQAEEASGRRTSEASVGRAESMLSARSGLGLQFFAGIFPS